MWNLLVGPWWPFLLASVILLVLYTLAWRYPQWRDSRWKAIEVSATLIMAAAAVSIPLVLDRNARETRTLELLNDVSRRIGEAVAAKDKKDHDNQKSAPEIFGYAYITSDPEIKAAVLKILNEYDYVCLGGNQGLFSNSIIENLRWDALDQTWKDYHDYIAEQRKGGGSKADAWIQCDIWLQQNPRVH